MFRQGRRQERAILASTYYTGRVHSILGQNLSIARSRRFGQFFSPLGIFDFWPKIEVNIFWIFFQKSVLGSPDNTLSNF